MKEHNGLSGQQTTKSSGDENAHGNGAKTLKNGRHFAVYADGEGKVAIYECDIIDEDDVGTEQVKKETVILKKPRQDDSDEVEDDDGSAIEMVGEVTLLWHTSCITISHI